MEAQINWEERYLTEKDKNDKIRANHAENLVWMAKEHRELKAKIDTLNNQIQVAAWGT